MNDTDRLEMILVHGWQVRRGPAFDDWSCYDFGFRVMGAGLTPRAAIDDAIIRQRASFEIDRPDATNTNSVSSDVEPLDVPGGIKD